MSVADSILKESFKNKDTVNIDFELPEDETMVLTATDPKFRFVEFIHNEEVCKQSARQYRFDTHDYLKYTWTHSSFYGTLILKNLLYVNQIQIYFSLHIFVLTGITRNQCVDSCLL